jgi:ABC-type Fe3+ transport system permease subunit
MVLLCALVGLCCLPPLGWMIWQVVAHARLVAQGAASTAMAGVLGRTLGYNLAASALACLLALPAAVVIGRGRGWLAGAILWISPLSLLFPSVVNTYGWNRALDLLAVRPAPGTAGDALRCIWAMATWLWAIPALAGGLALRRMDSQEQLQAMLDGALWRITLRRLIGPMAAALAVVFVLAGQEFAVYEPTGISVVATEMRTIFQAGVVGGDWTVIAGISAQAQSSSDQAQRAAAAFGAALPLLILVMALAGGGVVLGRRFSEHPEIASGRWPSVLDAPAWTRWIGALLVSLSVVAPLAAMVASLKRPLEPARVLSTFWPHLAGSLSVGLAVGLIVALVGLVACLRPSRLLAGLSLAVFLCGGLLLGIATIRLYNRPVLAPLYDGPGAIVMAQVARLAWLGLLVGAAAWAAPIRALREMAAADGAGPWQAAVHVVWPLAWPALAGVGVLAMVLTVTEVPTTVLLGPMRPPMLILPLMTWVHMQRSDDMIEGSLLLVAAVVVLGIALMILLRLGGRTLRAVRGPL